jgi:hypothetical protein
MRKVGTRKARTCKVRTRKAGGRHAGSRQLERRNLRIADADRRPNLRIADADMTHDAAPTCTARRDAAIRTANTRTSHAIVRTRNGRPNVCAAFARRSDFFGTVWTFGGTFRRTSLEGFWISEGTFPISAETFWTSEGNNPSGSSKSVASGMTTWSGGVGIRGGAREIAQVAPYALFGRG